MQSPLRLVTSLVNLGLEDPEPMDHGGTWLREWLSVLGVKGMMARLIARGLAICGKLTTLHCVFPE